MGPPGQQPQVTCKGLLNNSKFSKRQFHLTNSLFHHKQGACSKRPAQQGRRGFGARSVHAVREGERREERQVCEREARQRPENAAGGLFQQALLGVVAMHNNKGGLTGHLLKPLFGENPA